MGIRIKKEIPVGAGLGGGSSNAATVLLGLRQLFRIKVNRSSLISIAQQIGTDVPFFLWQVPIALGSGRGDKITPLRIKTGLWFVLVVPRLEVSTKEVYDRLDRIRGCKGTKALTNKYFDIKLFIYAFKNRNQRKIGSLLYNSLEMVTLSKYRELKQIKEKLSCLGARYVLMSGSGPAMFIPTSNKKEGVWLSRRIRRETKGKVDIVLTREW